MIPYCLSKSSCFFDFSWYANGVDLGAFMQNGLAPSFRDMLNVSPCIVVTCPSKTHDVFCCGEGTAGLWTGYFDVRLWCVLVWWDNGLVISLALLLPSMKSMHQGICEGHPYTSFPPIEWWPPIFLWVSYTNHSLLWDWCMMVAGCLCAVQDLSRFPALLQICLPESGSTFTLLIVADDVIFTMTVWVQALLYLLQHCKSGCGCSVMVECGFRLQMPAEVQWTLMLCLLASASCRKMPNFMTKQAHLIKGWRLAMASLVVHSSTPWAGRWFILWCWWVWLTECCNHVCVLCDDVSVVLFYSGILQWW